METIPSTISSMFSCVLVFHTVAYCECTAMLNVSIRCQHCLFLRWHSFFCHISFRKRQTLETLETQLPSCLKKRWRSRWRCWLWAMAPSANRPWFRGMPSSLPYMYICGVHISSSVSLCPFRTLSLSRLSLSLCRPADWLIICSFAAADATVSAACVLVRNIREEKNIPVLLSLHSVWISDLVYWWRCSAADTARGFTQVTTRRQLALTFWREK